MLTLTRDLHRHCHGIPFTLNICMGTAPYFCQQWRVVHIRFTNQNVYVLFTACIPAQPRYSTKLITPISDLCYQNFQE